MIYNRRMDHRRGVPDALCALFAGCSDPTVSDWFVGFGGLGQGCGTADGGNTCGNGMTCEAVEDKQAFGHVMVR